MGGRKPSIPDGSVFISYRRGDSAGHTGRLYDGLSAAFGDAAIFVDIDAIDPGVDFAQRIREALGTCRVVLVVIGPRWINASGDDGSRRLDDPQDYLRMEIAASIRRDGVLVIPVLVAGADMPTREELPEPLQPLALRQAVELSDARWNFDVARLEGVIRRAIATGSVLPPPEAHGQPGGSSGVGRQRPSGDRPTDGDGHGDDTVGARPPARIGSAVIATVLVVMLAGGAALWLNMQRPGGGETPGAPTSTDAGVVQGSTPAPSEPSAGATEASEPAEPAAEPEIAFVRDGELWRMDDGGRNVRPFLDDRALEVRHPDGPATAASPSPARRTPVTTRRVTSRSGSWTRTAPT